VRLTVAPAVPGYDPNLPDPSAASDQGMAGSLPEETSGELSTEEMIEEFLQSDVSLDELQVKVKHILERASEHVERGRTYKALKNKTQTRQSYQRAMRYYEQALRLDPDNFEARRGRQECLTRMSM
jgi:hypothetical protein